MIKQGRKKWKNREREADGGGAWEGRCDRPSLSFLRVPLSALCRLSCFSVYKLAYSYRKSFTDDTCSYYICCRSLYVAMNAVVGGYVSRSVLTPHLTRVRITLRESRSDHVSLSLIVLTFHICTVVCRLQWIVLLLQCFCTLLVYTYAYAWACVSASFEKDLGYQQSVMDLGC